MTAAEKTGRDKHGIRLTGARSRRAWPAIVRILDAKRNRGSLRVFTKEMSITVFTSLRNPPFMLFGELIGEARIKAETMNETFPSSKEKTMALRNNVEGVEMDKDVYK